MFLVIDDSERRPELSVLNDDRKMCPASISTLWLCSSDSKTPQSHETLQ